MSYTVVQNTSFLTAASILQKIISFFYFTVLARSIGVEDTGQYFFALTFTTIFIVIADFGFGNTLTREAAKFPEKGAAFVATAFWSKIIFGLGTYGLVLLATELLGYPPSLKMLIAVSGLTMFFDNLQTVFYSLLRARNNLLYEALGMVGSQLLTLSLGGLALYKGWPIYFFIIAYTIPSFCNLIYAAVVVKTTAQVRFWKGFNQAIFKEFLLLAWPIALAGLIGRLYAYSDSLLMSKMVSAEELGWWSVPYKMTFAFQFVPIAVAASLYPVISSLYIKEPLKIGEFISKAYRYLFTIIFPLTIGLGLLARPVIIYFYKIEFIPSIPVLQILLASLIFTYLTIINGAVLNAVGRQKTQTILISIALTINIILNLILLPRLGIRGAAWAALSSNIVLWSTGFWCIRSTIPFSLKNLIKYFNQTFWPAVGMGVVVFLLNERYLNWASTIPLAVVCYAALLLVSGGVTKPMIQEFRAKLLTRRI